MAVAFDAVGPSSAGAYVAAATTLSWTHTTVGASTVMVVAAVVGAATDSMTASVRLDPAGANTAFTAVGVPVHANNITGGYVQLFFLSGIGAASHTVQITTSASASIVGGSTSYTGCSSVGVQQSATGLSATASATHTGSTSTSMIAAALVVGASITSESAGTSRWIRNGDANTAGGNGAGADAAGGSSQAFTWAVGSDNWGVVAAELVAPVVQAEGAYNSSAMTLMRG